jgi:hypothetical protein
MLLRRRRYHQLLADHARRGHPANNCDYIFTTTDYTQLCQCLFFGDDLFS